MAQGKAGSSSPPSTASKPGSQLDTMLGSLQSDLNKLGVATVAKGVCGACKKPIAGQVSGRCCLIAESWAAAGSNGEGCFVRLKRLEMLEKLKYSIYPLARYAVSSSSDLYPALEGLPSPEMIGNSVFMLPQSRAHLSSRTCHSC